MGRGACLQPSPQPRLQPVSPAARTNGSNAAMGANERRRIVPSPAARPQVTSLVTWARNLLDAGRARHRLPAVSALPCRANGSNVCRVANGSNERRGQSQWLQRHLPGFGRGRARLGMTLEPFLGMTSAPGFLLPPERRERRGPGRAKAVGRHSCRGASLIRKRPGRRGPMGVGRQGRGEGRAVVLAAVVRARYPCSVGSAQVGRKRRGERWAVGVGCEGG